jgi:hypothetical protein
MTTAVATVTTFLFYAVFAATFWMQILPHTCAEAFVLPNSVDDASHAMDARTATAVSPFDSSVSTRTRLGSISAPSVSVSSTALRMGLFDSIASRFRTNNNNNNGDDDEKDFVRLDEMNEQFLGPGPVVLLYQVSDAIDDDEVRDMLADGAPTATQKGISMARIASLQDTTPSLSATGTATTTTTTTSTTAKKQYSLKSSSSSSSDEDDQQRRSSNTNNTKNSNLHLVDLSLRKALEKVIREPPPPILRSSTSQSMTATTFTETTNTNTNNSGCPVVIFSGFTNTEMMDSYNILGEELYKETASSSYNGKGQYLACATAVPNAMNKPLAQVLMEISGDHAAAMQPPSDDEDGSKE